MKKISVDILKPGIMFTEVAYIKPDSLFCIANKAVKKEDIDRLKKWGIEHIMTDGEIIEPRDEDIKTDNDVKIEKEFIRLEEKKQNLKDIYSNCLNNLKDVFDNIRNEKEVNLDNLRSIINLLSRAVEKSKELLLNFISTVQPDSYLPNHSLNVAAMSILLGNSLNLSITRINDLGLGALLHDIGMLYVPEDIIEKEDTLTDDEYNKIRTHPILGYKYLTQNLKVKNEIADIALQHHEKFGGGGYPRQIKAKEIAEFARIVAIADVFDAITKARSYKNETISYVALNDMLSKSKEQFDPHILKTFLSILSIYPVGSIVRLNNNAIAIIVKANETNPIRPYIKILVDEFGDKVEENIFYDLADRPQITIKKVVDHSKLKLKPFEIL